MVNKKFIYYKEDDMWIGWLEDYPDYRTQGESLDELKENLMDMYLADCAAKKAKPVLKWVS